MFQLIYVQDSVLTIKNSIFYDNTQESTVSEPRKGGFITYTGLAVNSFDHVLESNTFIDNDATLANAYSRWLNRGIPAVCQEDAPDGWNSLAQCTSLLTKYTRNCQSGNQDNFDCSNGIHIKSPINECVQFEACGNTSPSLNDIYPIDDSEDLSAYSPNQVVWTGTCEPTSNPTSAPSASPSKVSF